MLWFRSYRRPLSCAPVSRRLRPASEWVVDVVVVQQLLLVWWTQYTHITHVPYSIICDSVFGGADEFELFTHLFAAVWRLKSPTETTANKTPRSVCRDRSVARCVPPSQASIWWYHVYPINIVLYSWWFDYNMCVCCCIVCNIMSFARITYLYTKISGRRKVSLLSRVYAHALSTVARQRPPPT